MRYANLRAMTRMQFTRAAVTLLVTSVSVMGEFQARKDSPGARANSRAEPEIILTPSSTGHPVIEPAVSSAPSGSVIRLRRGVYRETVTITKPISLVGEAGAVIDPSEPFPAKWEHAMQFGAGVYRAAADRAPVSLLIDGKILAQVNLDRPETAQEGGRWQWKRLLAVGGPRTGFHYIRGVWLYLKVERAILVHLENDVDPSRHQWAAIWSKDPIVTLRDTHDASVRTVTLANGNNGIAITGNCLRCSVTRCKIGPWDKNGVMVRDGSTDCLVEGNEIFRGSYEDLTPVSISEPGSPLRISSDWYEVWQVHKLAGFWDRVGISITLSGSNNRLRGNHIHDVFDGINLGEGEIESLDAPVADSNHDRDAEISENIIERTGDSGIEVGGPAVNVRIHHNTLRKTHGGLRYKLPRLGPVFIYRNVLLDGSPFDIWYSMDDSPAEGYAYHNTVVGGRVGLAYGRWEKHHDIGAPRWHYLNNLIIAQLGFFETRDPAVPVNFTADYNVVVGGGRPYPDDRTKDSHSLYVDEVKMAPGPLPKPLPGSQAIDAGLDLSTYFQGKPLPGCEPGYFRGKAPDAGAYEIE